MINTGELYLSILSLLQWCCFKYVFINKAEYFVLHMKCVEYCHRAGCPQKHNTAITCYKSATNMRTHITSFMYCVIATSVIRQRRAVHIGGRVPHIFLPLYSSVQTLKRNYTNFTPLHLFLIHHEENRQQWSRKTYVSSLFIKINSIELLL